uniref:Uncharacterized protein n=1 Tax=Glossina brevipalpis TaxID=37001 RepID=A0A1A9WGL6_9MUSC
MMPAKKQRKQLKLYRFWSVSSRFATDSGSVSSPLFLTVGDVKSMSCSSSDSVDSLMNWLLEAFQETPMDPLKLNVLHDPDKASLENFGRELRPNPKMSIAYTGRSLDNASKFKTHKATPAPKPCNITRGISRESVFKLRVHILSASPIAGPTSTKNPRVSLTSPVLREQMNIFAPHHKSLISPICYIKSNIPNTKNSDTALFFHVNVTFLSHDLETNVFDLSLPTSISMAVTAVTSDGCHRLIFDCLLVIVINSDNFTSKK